MRSDLSIMWVEDTTSWYSEQKDILEMDIEKDLGIDVDITRISTIDEFYTFVEKNSTGFSRYDIFFIDYALSDATRKGSQIIVYLKEMGLSTDILFYSSKNIREIRDIVREDIDQFEGIYMADRDKDFRDKSFQLVEKNSKSLSSIKNIRGLLMDQTSENDFIVKTYISKKLEKLSPIQQEKIYKWFAQEIDNNVTDTLKKIDSYMKKKPNTIAQWLKLPSYMLPVQLQYHLLKKLLDITESDTFADSTIDDYLIRVVKHRNNLAHRKLVMCSQQQHLLHYKNVSTFLSDDSKICDNHEGEKVSIDDWIELRSEVKKYGDLFDGLWEGLFNN